MVKLRGALQIGGESYPAGAQVSWGKIYPFFFVHMLMFGASGFLIAYADKPPEVFFLYMHGGFAIFVYLIFYLVIFGLDEIKWMFINAALGLFGIVAQIDWILGWFDKTVDDFAWYVHVIPFLYYIMYTFLLRQALIDGLGVREQERESQVNGMYVVVSVVAYSAFYLL